MRYSITGLMGYVILAISLSLPLSAQMPMSQQTVTLFVIDFDNIAGDSRLDWLAKALKDMVLLKMDSEVRISAKDAGSISPFLEAREDKFGDPSQASNSLLLMGTYHRSGALLVIELQLLDLRDWSSVGATTVEAPYSDVPEVNRVLSEKIGQMTRDLDYYSGLDLDAPISDEEVLSSRVESDILDPSIRYGQQGPPASRDMLHALDDLEHAMDVYSGFQKEGGTETQQSGKAYYREFSLEGEGSLPAERERHTVLFEALIEQVAQNPYSAEIGELSLEVDPYNKDKISLEIPVTYRIKQTLLEDMLYSLPYVSSREQGRLRFVTYDRSKFNFSASLLGGIARGDFRIIPVVQLLDQQGRLAAVIIDSPDMTWERYFPSSSVKIVRQRNFISMMAITTSGFSVDVRMEIADLETRYKFDVDASQLPGMARVAVVFMKEQDLLQFLRTLPRS